MNLMNTRLKNKRITILKDKIRIANMNLAAARADLRASGNSLALADKAARSIAHYENWISHHNNEIQLLLNDDWPI